MRRMSISATTLSVGVKSPLWLRLLGIFTGLALAAAVGVWLYDLGSSFAGVSKDEVQQELNKLRAENRTLTEDRERLTKLAISAESSLSIEKATSKQIASQSKQLESDNAKLKEDLAFFESLLPANSGAEAISVRNVRAQFDAVNKTVAVRTLVMQGGKKVSDFVGNLQVILQGTADGKPYFFTYPATEKLATEGKLAFAQYKRVELNFALPDNLPKNVQLKSVQVKVLQGSQTRATANASVIQSAQAATLAAQ